MKLVGNYRFQKAANTSLVLDYLIRKGDAPRAVIARDIGLKASTVTQIVHRLLDAGLVVERSVVEESGNLGRPGVNIGINADFGRVIGCDLQADYYSAVVTDITGRVLHRFRREYTVQSDGFEALMEQVLAEIVHDSAQGVEVIGAGVAIPGIVSVAEPRIEECWTHRITSGLDLGAFIDRTFPYTVLLENDANACAWKTLWYDSERTPDSFIYLLPRFHRRELLEGNVPSVGIGMGLVFNGEVYRGVTNRAGEFMSASWNPNDRAPGQLHMPRARLDSVGYDRRARRELVVEVLSTLARFIHMTNPRSLYIGGDLAGERELVDDVLHHDLEWFWTEFVANGGTVIVLDEATFEPAQGAAARVLDRLYSVPRLGHDRTILEPSLVALGDDRRNER